MESPASSRSRTPDFTISSRSEILPQYTAYTKTPGQFAWKIGNDTHSVVCSNIAQRYLATLYAADHKYANTWSVPVYCTWILLYQSVVYIARRVGLYQWSSEWTFFTICNLKSSMQRYVLPHQQCGGDHPDVVLMLLDNMWPSMRKPTILRW